VTENAKTGPVLAAGMHRQTSWCRCINSDDLGDGEGICVKTGRRIQFYNPGLGCPEIRVR
jgi:hypothetical protein